VAIGTGFALVLYAGFELWGTGLLQARDQARLRATLEQERTGPARTAPGPTPSPPATPILPSPGEPIARIEIATIGVDQVVVEGVDAAQLRLGPGHYPGTPLPGQPGNVAIAGHRTTYGHPFADLNALLPGDRIVLLAPRGTFVYSVSSLRIVQPTDVSVLAPTAGPALTLTTCTPRFSAAARLVVRAELVSPGPGPAPGPAVAAPPSDPPGRAAPSPSAPATAATPGGWLALAGDDAVGAGAPAALVVAAGVAALLVVPRAIRRCATRWRRAGSPRPW
jgi:sortase A